MHIPRSAPRFEVSCFLVSSISSFSKRTVPACSLSPVHVFKHSCSDSHSDVTPHDARDVALSLLMSYTHSASLFTYIRAFAFLDYFHPGRDSSVQ